MEVLLAIVLALSWMFGMMLGTWSVLVLVHRITYTRDVRRRGKGKQADLDKVIQAINERVTHYEQMAKWGLGQDGFYFNTIQSFKDITPKQRRIVVQLLKEGGYHSIRPSRWWHVDSGHISYRWD